MGGDELAFIHKAFESNWIAPLGPNVDGFESDLSLYLGNNSKIALLNSGTSAIHLGLKLLGVESNDDVLCQSFTFSASANPIKYLGANPIFIDSEEATWNMCPLLLEKAIIERISSGKKPKAIIAVHLYGMPYDVDKITNISKQYGIPVLEDSAEALGSTYNQRPCGTFGDISVLSFNGNKIITTSGGGALVTKNSKLRDEAVYLATQARDSAPHYQHSEIGFNYRMSNVLAGIGRGQMRVLDERVAGRRSNYEFYKEEFKGIEQITFLDEREASFSNRWLTCILTPSFKIREKFRLALEKNNIESRPLWKPMHMQPIFKNYPNYCNGVCENLFERGLCLPSGTNLSIEDLQRTVAIIKKNTK
ncbi:pyridoxal phosphate-dependent aminotransferase [Maribacter sp. MJ134]|uniref:DegT/DnrJ/EryC1/StrS family aminotransferase n=1 Tax=Maribacter sp. MJ134 TaxID=2496865 RepID=UPI000F84869C|nr:DegT/DnrJ/EryC1/StrS family aminotransferase [Maribacter sp. MJ134]AZQ60538.1 pyridoxal phosphate-dependent aminotransferase [Maribacter sp. MJ134]